MFAETINIRLRFLPNFRFVFIKAQHSLCMRNSVSDEMLYLEAGGKEKTGREEKEEEDRFEFVHRAKIKNSQTISSNKSKKYNILQEGSNKPNKSINPKKRRVSKLNPK